MGNYDTIEAKNYHEETKHSEVSVRSDYFLDWEDKPNPYKVYANLAPIFLPKDFPRPTQDTIDCVKTFESGDDGVVNLGSVAEILYFTAGVTKKIRLSSGGTYDFRAAASTGALYEVEVYVVCGQIPALSDGVYHFNPQDFALQQLRDGHYRYSLSRAAGNSAEILNAPMSLVLTAIYWRNAWKYRARSYRHFYWDAGTITANLLATAISTNLKAKIILGFQDKSVSQLLGLDSSGEAALAIIPLGRDSESKVINEKTQTLTEINHEYAPLSKKEIQYQEVLKIHSVSSLNSAEEVSSWPRTCSPKINPQKRGQFYPLQPLTERRQTTLSKTIVRRGSTRRFSREAIPFSYLSTIIQAATGGVPTDFLDTPDKALIETYLIVNAVDGLQSGSYYYDRENESLELLKLGDFRDTAGYLCLEQDLGADGSVATFLMCNLNSILDSYGNRGYRAAQLEAGIIAGKMYLCAYALGIGASGITFYDDHVTEFFSPHAVNKSNMLSVILGVPAAGSMRLINRQAGV
ncbi:MAG TPA: SagB/ThcOx family dehydrogenase [Candidatus Bathyarchaeia archaeon]|nr:SagB/ThcOx family dehydrogenase [Candidatus Bathyarchaeia archaeon]